MSGWSAGTLKPPDSLVVTTRLSPVFALVIVTAAPAIALSEASTTVPEIVPVTVWAAVGPQRNIAQNRQDNNFAQCALMEDIRTSSSVYGKAQHKLTLCVALSSGQLI